MSRLPFTNVLDLDMWICIQAKVKRIHFLQRSTTDALVESVNQVWDSADISIQITKVFDKLNVVLCNIFRGQGRNDLVKVNRGVKDIKIKIE